MNTYHQKYYHSNLTYITLEICYKRFVGWRWTVRQIGTEISANRNLNNIRTIDSSATWWICYINSVTNTIIQKNKQNIIIYFLLLDDPFELFVSIHTVIPTITPTSIKIAMPTIVANAPELISNQLFLNFTNMTLCFIIEICMKATSFKIFTHFFLIPYLFVFSHAIFDFEGCIFLLWKLFLKFFISMESSVCSI